jgi:hypothetical protein
MVMFRIVETLHVTPLRHFAVAVRMPPDDVALADRGGAAPLLNGPILLAMNALYALYPLLRTALTAAPVPG